MLWQLCFPVSLLNHSIQESGEKGNYVEFGKFRSRGKEKVIDQVVDIYLQKHRNVSLRSKEVLESIEEPLAKKEKTAESCVETSNVP